MINYLNKKWVNKITRTDFVPPEIIDRKYQKKELDNYCFENIESAENILITGDVSGSGKTVLVKHYLKNKLSNKGIYINTTDMSNFSLAKTLALEIGKLVNKEPKGRDITTFTNFCKKVLEKYNNKIIIVLDEIDGYLNKNEDISTLYSIAELSRIDNKSVLILISNDIDFKKKLLNKYLGSRINSRLCLREVFFDKYAVSEAAEILLYYSKLLLKPKYFDGNKLTPLLLQFVRDLNEFDIRLLLKNYIAILRDNEKYETPLLTYDKQILISNKLQNNWLTKFERLTETEKIILLSLIILDTKLEENKENATKFTYYKNLEPTTKLWLKVYNQLSSKITNYTPVKERLFKYIVYSLENQNFVEHVIKYYGKGKGRKAIWFPHIYLKEISIQLFELFFGKETAFIDYTRGIELRQRYI